MWLGRWATCSAHFQRQTRTCRRFCTFCLALCGACCMRGGACDGACVERGSTPVETMQRAMLPDTAVYSTYGRVAARGAAGMGPAYGIDAGGADAAMLGALSDDGYGDVYVATLLRACACAGDGRCCACESKTSHASFQQGAVHVATAADTNACGAATGRAWASTGSTRGGGHVWQPADARVRATDSPSRRHVQLGTPFRRGV